MNRIPFNYELYLSGKYDAVYRDCPNKIVSIEPDIFSTLITQLVVRDDAGNEWLIYKNGMLWDWGEDENDVFLIEKE